jgi:DNA-binding GntR family transcriptional regulator
MRNLLDEVARRTREEGGDEVLRSRIRECRNAIYSACHNGLLAQLLEAMQLRARQFRAAPLFYLAGRPLETMEEMRKIATAIESRDGELAEQSARQHRRTATELRLKAIRAERKG